MKKVLFLMILLFLIVSGTATMNAQVKIGENTVPRKGAVLDLNGSYKGGLLLPNVEIVDLGAIPVAFDDKTVAGAPEAWDLTGMMVWNTRTGSEGVYVWDGTDWKLVMGGTTTPPQDCTVPPAVTSITGFSGTVNLNAVFDVTCTATSSGATVYRWIVASGLEVVSGTGTNRITLKGTAGNIYPGNSISCTVSNGCGDATLSPATSLTVNSCSAAPAEPGYISFDKTTIKVGETLTATCEDITDATSYVWTLPDGLTPRTQTTPGSTLVITGTTAKTFDLTSVTVQSSNACGQSLAAAGQGQLLVEAAGPGDVFLGASGACANTEKNLCRCMNGSLLFYDDATVAQRASANTMVPVGTYWWRNSSTEQVGMKKYESSWTAGMTNKGQVMCF